MFNRILNRVKRDYKYCELKFEVWFPRGTYKFSKCDLELYKTEIGVKLDPPKVINKDYLNKVSFDKSEIFWPVDYSHDDLPWLYHEIFDEFSENPSSYDHPMMSHTDRSWVIDAGCCEGFYSKFIFSKNRDCKVIAIEPLQAMKSALGQSFHKEIELGQFFLEQCALGKKNDEMDFVYNASNPCDSFLGVQSDSSCKYKKNKVRVTTLDEISATHGLDLSRGLVKMDIEGAEMDALLGAEKTLRDLKPNLAIAVYHSYENASKCAEIIKSINPDYNIEFRGMYGYFTPSRPYILFAW
ncbi:FkbM family methyltransferase [Vibrio hepatarius]|uniref:FkbM family methyltransferase n=1 Tax=Vibrio hepatarius TaxID=171383 RepID=UPI001C08D096|nr:FkbM family methyltransferase [Vibrio hepatarius]MBU2896874.1 FkbM family methyltransferase [Vibrio hepatarius]